MMHLCTPALIYFILAIMSILLLIVNKTTVLIVFTNMVVILLWTWFLNFVCNKGFTTISWILVLSPYIITLIALATGLVKMSDLQQAEAPKKEKEPLVLI